MIEFDLKRPPEEAVRLIESKTNRPSYSWREVWKDAHQRSFTVAKAMESDILDDIREMVEKAVKSGITLKQFQDELEPKLRAKGWWGRSVMVNPMTGMPESVTLGTPWRLKTIYRTNLQTAYQCGRYQRMTAPSEKIYRPLWQYLAVMDGRTRPSHAAMNGKIFKADDPIWGQGLYPPRGFNCRCTVRALTEKQIETAGLTERIADDGTIRYDFGKGKVEVGKDALLKTKNSIADDGWDYHPCEGWTPKTETETPKPKTETPKPKTETKDAFSYNRRPDNFSSVWRRLYGSTSKEYQERIKGLINKIPKKDLAELAGYEFSVGEYILDVCPDLKGVRPRGWPEGTTCEDIAGLFRADNKKIVICEKDRKRKRETWETDTVFAHETGHAINHARKKAGKLNSDHPEFMRAYDEDVRALGKEDRARCKYLLQEGRSGRDETFAELYSAKISGDKWLRHYFPKTHEAMEAK